MTTTQPSVTTNPVFEVVRTVLAVREYQDRPVPDDVVARIVEAGRLSASASNLQPWHFVVVRNRAHLSELGELVPTGPYIATSAFAIVVAYERSTRTAVSDASRAVQSMILTAWAEGVGSNWAGFGGLDDVRHSVGLPDSYDVLAVIAFGYPARPVGRGKKNRKPMSAVASAERYGAPFSAG
jgi:nitroreductase